MRQIAATHSFLVFVPSVQSELSQTKSVCDSADLAQSAFPSYVEDPFISVELFQPVKHLDTVNFHKSNSYDSPHSPAYSGKSTYIYFWDSSHVHQ